jgi:hypothetical protein
MFEFTIIATGLDPEAEDFESRFYDGDCHDASVSFQKGHILLDFAREADTLELAISSAVSDAQKAGATVKRVEPDPLVSLSDIASRAEMTRAAMTNYVKGHRQDGFPPPRLRVTTSSPLWDWADVAIWLYRRDRLDLETARNAVIVSAANDVLECAGDFSSALHRRIEAREPELA